GIVGIVAHHAPHVQHDRLGSVLTAIILVRASRDRLSTLGPKLAETAGVAEVYTVTGDWDFVAIIRVREHEELATIVTRELVRLDGIERTHTMVAFQQFSHHDLEAMFGLGLEA
ncbi:MAG TPA: Lrp/AsnC family transcriptional regulator, partial [Candidatus Eisenbacteria bacterium]|nr:Lrp/AsnC family transcriptional regulator [Candidatus Eisenbacteria bacterium]